MKRSLIALMFVTATSTVFAQQRLVSWIEQEKPLKRGSNYVLHWTGSGAGSASVELKGGRGVMATWSAPSSDGTLTVRIPKRLKPTNGYFFVIRSESGEVTTSTFSVRRKIPMVVQVSTIAVIPVFYFILSKDNGVGVEHLDPPVSPPGN